MCGSSLHGSRKYLDPLKLKDPLGLFDAPPEAPEAIRPPSDAPRMQDPAVMLMRNRERRRLQGESGRRSTILTSGQGAVMDKIQNKTLLGS